MYLSPIYRTFASWIILAGKHQLANNFYYEYFIHQLSLIQDQQTWDESWKLLLHKKQMLSKNYLYMRCPDTEE